MMKPKKLSKTSSEFGLRQKCNSGNRKVNQDAKRTDCTVTSGTTNPTTKGSFHICARCRKPIRKDRFLLEACDRYWHEDCLRCDHCHGRLGELGSTLYQKSNLNLCKRDYLEMFGETGICSVCEQIIRPSEMVMRAKQNVYHLECFACQLCNQRFCVGDRFYLCENKVVCEYDYDEHIVPIQRSMIDQAPEHSHYITNFNSHIEQEDINIQPAQDSRNPKISRSEDGKEMVEDSGPAKVQSESNGVSSSNGRSIEELEQTTRENSSEREHSVA